MMLKQGKVMFGLSMWLLGLGWASANDLYWLSEPTVDVGLMADNDAEEIRLSNTSRYMSFVSKANNLVVNDLNHVEDLFMTDLQTGITQLVSVTASGVQASTAPIYQFSRPSADGRYVAFASDSSEYPGGNGEDHQLYVKDLVSGQLLNASGYGVDSVFELTSGGIHMMDDGQSLIFTTRAEIDPLHVGNSSAQAYHLDLTTGQLTLLSTALDGLSAASGNTHADHVSSNGRYVLLRSRADNISAELLNNNGENLFILDRLDDGRTLANITASGDSSADATFSKMTGQVSNQGTVVFTSQQDDLVPNDNNNRIDVFYFDGVSVSRINVDALGDEMSNFASTNDVAISGDGQRVMFTEYSDELFPADTNQSYDLYSLHTGTGVLSLVSQNALGLKLDGSSFDPQMGALGDVAVFTSYATDLTDDPAFSPNLSIFYQDFNTGNVEPKHVAAFTPQTVMNDANHVKVSSDLMTVVFSSKSPNLVSEPINDSLDLFCLDRQTGDLSRIAANINSYEHSLSPSGRYVSFRTAYLPPEGVVALSGYQLYRYDRQTDTFQEIAEGYNNQVSDEGAVLFDSYDDLLPADSNGALDLYAYNPNNGAISLVSEDLTGAAAGIQDFDMGGSDSAVWVTFTSDNEQIVSDDNNGFTDVFLRQLGGGNIQRVSQRVDGTQANSWNRDPAISANGRWVAYISEADNLTADDYTNANSAQVLLFDRQTRTHSLVSRNDRGQPLTQDGTSGISQVGVSDAGRYVAYVFDDADPKASDEDRLGVVLPEFAGDTDGQKDLVLFDTNTQSGHIISRLTDGTETLDEVKDQFQIRSDADATNPQMGVAFIADHGTLTGRIGHPGHEEVYLYTASAVDLDLIFKGGFD